MYPSRHYLSFDCKSAGGWVSGNCCIKKTFSSEYARHVHYGSITLGSCKIPVGSEIVEEFEFQRRVLKEGVMQNKG